MPLISAGSTGLGLPPVKSAHKMVCVIGSAVTGIEAVELAHTVWLY